MQVSGRMKSRHTIQRGDCSRAEYDQQIERLLDDKLRLYEQYLRGEVGLDDYKAQTSAYDEQLLKTKNARSAWMVQVEQTKEADDRRRNRKQAIQEIIKADKLTNGLSELLIEKVYVFAGNRIEIAYKMQDIFS